jgi:hypothetical protein
VILTSLDLVLWWLDIKSIPGDPLVPINVRTCKGQVKYSIILTVYMWLTFKRKDTAQVLAFN